MPLFGGGKKNKIEFDARKELPVEIKGNIAGWYGSNKKVTVKEFQKVILPEDKAQFIELIKGKGLWEEYSRLNYSRLNGSILSGSIDEEIKQLARLEPTYRLYVSSRIDKR